MACKTQEFFFEGGDAYFGVEHCREVTAVAESGLNVSDYFELNGFKLAATSTDEFISESLFYVYTGTDPALTGKTGINYTTVGGETASEVATLIKDAIEANVDANKVFKVTQNGSLLDIENRIFGEITPEDVSNSALTFSVGKEGAGGFLGRTNEAIEVSFTTNSEVVNTNQTGAIVVDEIFTGQEAEASLSLIELTRERKQFLVSTVGGKVDFSGSIVAGFGESKLFQSLRENGGRLVIHPRRLANNDRSRDVSFHKSAPKPESLNFDGTSLQQFPVTFTGYIDSAVNEEINLATIDGDWGLSIGAV